MADKRSKLLSITDDCGTRVQVVERRASEWQRELRVDVRGVAVGGNVREGSRSSGGFPIKSPAELVDFLSQLTTFLEHPSAVQMRFRLGPHGRLAGTLECDHAGMVYWMGLEKGYCRDLKVQVDPTALVALRDAVAAYS